MARIAPPRQQFENIFRELHDDQYLIKEVTARTPGCQPARQYTQPQNDRQKAVLVDMTLKKARRFAEQGMITPQQELAIEELATVKKEQIAQYNFLLNPRSTFKSQGDIYQLVQLENGNYACANTSEYQLCADGATWFSKRSPHISFVGAPICGSMRVPADKLSLVSEALKHRPIAYDILSTWHIEEHPAWQPIYTEKLAKARLSESHPGTFIIHPGSGNKTICLTYKVEQGVFHERFDKETGFLEGDTNDIPETIYQRMDQLDQVSRQTGPSRLVREPHPQPNRTTEARRGPMIRHVARQTEIAPPQSVANREHESHDELMTEEQARDEIQLLAPGYAVPYRMSDGVVRILIKVKSRHVKDPYVLDLRYFPDKHEVAVKSRQGRINAAEYLRSIGVTEPVLIARFTGATR